jgi:hypothetical protein
LCHESQVVRYLAGRLTAIRRLGIESLVVLLASGCLAFPPVVSLPTRGQVFFERKGGALEPAAGVLVLAERLDLCDRAPMGEASSTGIDSFLVRTDPSGSFELPPRTFMPCSRVTLEARAAVPGWSTHLNPDKRVVTLRPAPPSAVRVIDIHGGWATGYKTTQEDIRKIYLELLPEIAPLLARHREKSNELAAQEIMYVVGQNVFLVDWERLAPDLRESLVEAFFGNGEGYRLLRPPQRAPAYYVGELDGLAQAMTAAGAQAELDSTEVIRAIQAVAILDNDWDVDPRGERIEPWRLQIRATTVSAFREAVTRDESLTTRQDRLRETIRCLHSLGGTHQPRCWPGD